MNTTTKNSAIVSKITAVIALVAMAFLLFAAKVNRANAAEGSVALPNPSVDAPLASTPGKQTAVVAGGCFW